MKHYKLLAALAVSILAAAFLYRGWSVQHYRALCALETKQVATVRKKEVEGFYKNHTERDRELDDRLSHYFAPKEYTKSQLNNAYRECLAQHGMKPEDLYNFRP